MNRCYLRFGEHQPTMLIPKKWHNRHTVLWCCLWYENQWTYAIAHVLCTSLCLLQFHGRCLWKLNLQLKNLEWRNIRTSKYSTRPRPADDLWNRAFDFAEDCWLLLAPRLALLFFLRIGPVEPVEPDELDITGWFYTATGYRHLNSNVARCRQDAKNLHKDSEVGVKTR